jgi:phage terminase large subunit GpA-like protein
MSTKVIKGSHNLNTTIDKIAMSEFKMHYYQLGDNEKQWCHDEMVNNKKWLKKDWEKPLWSVSDKWKAGLPIYKTYK